MNSELLVLKLLLTSMAQKSDASMQIKHSLKLELTTAGLIKSIPKNCGVMNNTFGWLNHHVVLILLTRKLKALPNASKLTYQTPKLFVTNTSNGSMVKSASPSSHGSRNDQSLLT